MTPMKNTLTATGLLAAALLASAGAQAQTAQSGQTAQTPAPAAAEPTSPFSFNVGVVSDYRFRGISQTRLRPALQGGVDFAHPSGAYVGLWASTIKWIKDAGGKADVEIDLYGGYKGKITEDFAYDLGLLRYQYPGSKLAVTPNTTEAYGAVTYGPATLKYSRVIGDETFGVANSKGTYYLQLDATFDLGNGFALVPHIGRQDFTNRNGANNNAASYTDYALGVTKDLGNGLSVSLTAVGTNADRTFYTSAATAGSKYLGKDGLVVGLKYAF
jgi:uncharacterized protein (TIGR02001 family)